MFGIALIIIATACEEFSDSSAKRWMGGQSERLYSFALLSVIWGAFLFTALFIIRGGTIDPRSLPFLGTRFVFEILQMFLTVQAIAKADRSTFGFLRILTIPLLLAVDISLGYNLSLFQTIGTALIVVTLLILYTNHGLGKTGRWYIIGSAVNAVITISLFQYDIKHFNSIEAEQAFIYLSLSLFFMLVLLIGYKGALPRFFKENFLTKRSFANGIGSFVMSYAYLFAPASVVVAGKRASSVLASLISGKVVFKEKHFLLKLSAGLLITLAMALLSVA